MTVRGGKIALSIVLSGVLAVTGTASALAQESDKPVAAVSYAEHAKLTDIEVDKFASEVADSFVVLFRDVIKRDGQKFYIDESKVYNNGFKDSSEQLKVIVDNLNNFADNPYTKKSKERSWSSFGNCVVTGILGFSPLQINYNLLGKYIYEKSWNKVADLLKQFAKREIKKKAGSVVLSQIIKATPAGFAAWLGVYAIGCAGKEAWNWWRP